jgi:prolipoprotein diacylglyceryl transferase
MFDLLSITWDVSPDILQIGSFHLKWYSILFVVGFFPIGYYIMRSFYKREGIPVENLDYLLYALLICALVGSRLGHVFFYDWSYYSQHPWEILATWKGGLASHGGAVGVLIAMWWYVKKYGKQFGFGYVQILDRIVIPICFAGMFIRFGNLFNSEIYGHATNLPWGFIFVRDGQTIAKHPTQLYEAFSYLLLGIGLVTLYLKKLDKLKTGTIFGIFLICLFGARFLIEFVKEPQEAFEQTMVLNMGQWLSVPFILAGISILIYSIKWGKPARIIVPGTQKNTPKVTKGKTPLAHTKSLN